MSHLFYYLPALACPVAMGAMMWLMMRGGKSTAKASGTAQPSALSPDQQAELARLRIEIDELKKNPTPQASLFAR